MEINKLYKIYLEYNIISTDSRNISKDCLYFALKGENFNGNDFAVSAIENGAKYSIIDDKKFINHPNCIYVNNVLETLQQLASYHRDNLSIPVIGITGTNGKTTTKELIREVLKENYNVIATEGNLNNHIGVPLTLLKIKKDTEIAIIEMGANHPLEIDFLCKIAKPNLGIITNIGKAHLEGFGGFEGVIKTKSELYNYIKHNKNKIFINSDNEILNKISQDIDSIKYSKSGNSDIIGKSLTQNGYLEITYEIINKNISDIIKTNLIGDYNLENILAAITVGDYFKINHKNINNAISKYIPSNNRSELITNTQFNNTIILDAYNANPTSMDASINSFIESNKCNKVLILGDMLELGEYSYKEHNSILEKLNNLNNYKVFLVGKNFFNFKDKFNFNFFKDTNELNDSIIKNPIIDSYILLKGSRGIKLEKLKENL